MRTLVVLLLFAAVVACSGARHTGNDAYVTVDVKAKLAGVDVDSANAVSVSATDGTVILTGRARSESERQAYLAAARSVDGVKAVDDRLAIDPSLQGIREQSSDAALAAKVSAAIAGQAGVNVFKINVGAHDGTVSLDGTVPSDSIERTIVDTARSVDGVKRVLSRLRVQP